MRLPKWGIEAATSAAVPEDVKALGVRAFFLQRVDGPGENCYRVRVDRVSDSRFERTVLLGFLDRDESEAPTVSRTDDEMKYLHQHLFWRVDKSVSYTHLSARAELALWMPPAPRADCGGLARWGTGRRLRLLRGIVVRFFY